MQDDVAFCPQSWRQLQRLWPNNYSAIRPSLQSKARLSGNSKVLEKSLQCKPLKFEFKLEFDAKVLQQDPLASIQQKRIKSEFLV